MLFFARQDALGRCRSEEQEPQSVHESNHKFSSGIILTEVLRGIRKDRDYQKTRERMNALLYLPMSRKTFITAAELYRGLRKKGLTVRKPLDHWGSGLDIRHFF